MSGRRINPRLFLLSGPSGAGKDTVLTGLKAKGLPFFFVTTVTTRPPRQGERDGRDYHFASSAQFEQMQQTGKLLEWAQVYGHWYGVPREEVEGALSQGKSVVIKVDVQGAKTLKQLFPQAVLIFLAPPSWQALVERLRQRHTESEEQFALRLKTVEEEMKALPLFDYKVVNSQMDKAVAEVEAIITASPGS